MTADRTLGVLEARGMAALLAATDAMLKAAAVDVTGYHRVGSGWVTVTVEGDTGAVQTALVVGREQVERIGELIAADVVVHPDKTAIDPMPHPHGLKSNKADATRAVGVLETVGLTPLLPGTDAMIKAASVDIHGWSPIGGALAHTIIRGDMHSVQAAVEAGAAMAARHGNLHATLVLPVPSNGLESLLPTPFTAESVLLDALGILETTGYLGAIAGADAMTKAAEIDLLRLTVGSGGRVGVLIKGNLEEVEQALSAGAQQAGSVGEYNAHCAIARPEPGMVACFGGSDPSPVAGEAAGNALGLIETRSTVALVSAIDQMMKTANVVFEGRCKVGAYNTAAVIRGDLSAVRVALDVGHSAASSLGETTYTHLIPAPLATLESHLMHRSDSRG